METLTLPLYPQIESKPKITPQLVKESSKEPLLPASNLENTINSLFPTQEEENKITRMRNHLGQTAKDLSDIQVETIMTEFQFFIDSWMDEYEKEVLNGKTLKEVLNGG